MCEQNSSYLVKHIRIRGSGGAKQKWGVYFPLVLRPIFVNRANPLIFFSGVRGEGRRGPHGRSQRYKKGEGQLFFIDLLYRY